MNAPKGRDGGVDTRQLHSDETAQQPAAASGAVSLVPDAGGMNVERRELRDELMGKLISSPIVFNDWRDFGLHEVAHALNDCPLFRIELVSDPIEVAIHGGRDESSFFRASPVGRRGVYLLLL